MCGPRAVGVSPTWDTGASENFAPGVFIAFNLFFHGCAFKKMPSRRLLAMPFGIAGRMDRHESRAELRFVDAMNHSKSPSSNCHLKYACAIWRRAVLAILAITALSQSVFALDPSRALTQTIHRIWQTQQGLPQGTIYCVYQTQDRYLWLGTKTGLVRFDGVQFTVVRDLSGVSLENVWVRQLCEDDDHAMWIATDRDGLICWKDGTATRFTTENGLPSNSVHCLRTDRQQNVWIGTDRGLARFTAGRIEAVTGNDGPGSAAIKAICETTDGAICVAGDGNRLYVKRADAFSVVTLDSLPESTAITALVGGVDGSLWIGSADGLVHFEHDQQRRYTTADGLSDEQIFCLTQGSNGSLWIGTSDGFNRFRDGKFQSFRTRDGLSQSTVYSICEDHEGSLWVGTKLGLNQFIDRRTIPFTITEGLPSNNTGPIEQDIAGNTWIGTLDAGLARWNGTGFSKLTAAEGLPSDSIRALAAASAGSLWVGTDQGLCRVEEQKIVDKLTTQTGLPANEIRTLCCDAAGALWIGTPAGIVSWQSGKLTKEQLPTESAEQPSIVGIAELSGNTIVAAVKDGPLLARKSGEWKPFETYGARPAYVSSLHSDGDALYVTTAGDGLYIFEGQRAIHLSVREGLYDDELFGLASDKQGHLWIACSKGVFSIEREDVRKFADREIAAVPTAPLSPLDSLRTVECQSEVQPAVKLMRDGRIWFSTIRGVLVIDPSHWQRVLPATAVVVEDVIINGKSENPRQFQSVPPGNANLTFHYAALSYTSPSRITFRYRLEGFDRDWVDAGSRREAFYTNIPPGRYKFVVAATNADGKLYETQAPVELRIAPYLYQTVWFLPLCGTAAALAIWFAWRFRVRAIRQKMNAIVVERSRIARELHDGLMQGFAGITMEMQALSSRLPEESTERETLEEIIGDAGNCLREARRSIAGLRGAPSGLAAAIEQAAQQLAQTHDVRLKLHLDPVTKRLSTETEYNLLRIAQEAITNALKHSGASVVDVVLECTANEIRLIVRDDGSGFAEGEANLENCGHYGLIGMRERAHQIGAQFNLQSNSGRGTAVRVILPTRPSPADVPM
jgi:ligand-binding sensor domain-containing protein/signal transduction histidine kinase